MAKCVSSSPFLLSIYNTQRDGETSAVPWTTEGDKPCQKNHILNHLMPIMLVKKVPGHLFKFEEKIFGMSLQQLLTDLGVFTGCFSLTGSLHLLARLIVCAVMTLFAMLFVHGKVQGHSLSYWCYFYIRSKMIPTQTIWRPANTTDAHPKQKGLPSIQEAWIPIDTLHHGIAGKSDQHKKTVVTRFWMVFEIEGKNIHLFPEHEQARIFHRFESFLTGLEFHLQFLSQTEQIDPLTAEPLRMQKEALSTLARDATSTGTSASKPGGTRTADDCLYTNASFSGCFGIQHRRLLPKP